MSDIGKLLSPMLRHRPLFAHCSIRAQARRSLLSRFWYQVQICLGLDDCEICHAVFPSSTKPEMQGRASQVLQHLSY